MIISLPTHAAELVVIVHASNTVTLTQAYIKRLFLGKIVYFPGGKAAIPINVQSGTDLRSTFERTILNKSSAQVRSYWAKRVFTGKGGPPKEAHLNEIVQMIANNPRMIGYTTGITNLSAQVRVIGHY